MLKRLVCAGVSLLLSFSAFSAPQKSQVTSDRFHHLFTTAAYATALGAAVGTAILPFTPRPSENLRVIAIGGAIGLFSGVLLGSYLAFVPSYKSKGQKTAFEPGLIEMPKVDRLTVETVFDDEGLDAVALHFPVVRL